MSRYREDAEPSQGHSTPEGSFTLRITNTAATYKVYTSDKPAYKWVEVEFRESGEKEAVTVTAEREPWDVTSKETINERLTRPFFWNAIRALRESGIGPPPFVLRFYKVYTRPLNPP